MNPQREFGVCPEAAMKGSLYDPTSKPENVRHRREASSEWRSFIIRKEAFYTTKALEELGKGEGTF